MPSGHDRGRLTVVSPVDAAFRTEWSGLVATLTRELRDVQFAQDVAQEAFAEASRVWRRRGAPDRPGAWLLVTARRKAIDTLRRRERFDARLDRLAAEIDRQPTEAQRSDDQLALIFGCCHPALPPEAQVALTLRSVGGLTTAQIARAFLVPVDTMTKRLQRARHKIRAAGIRFTVPTPERIAERRAAVAGVVYAIFTEGHASASGPTLLRGDLCDEAIHVAALLVEVLPDDAEMHGLAALCLLTDARRAARFDADGSPVLLRDQDRSRWDRAEIARGLELLTRARDLGDAGPYVLQAWIAALHATAPDYESTQWSAIVGVYDAIVRAGGGSVAALNRAVAIGERDGPAAGLAAIEAVTTSAPGELDDYHYVHTARAELLARLGRVDEAIGAYTVALAACDNAVERRWIEERAAALRLASGR